MKFQTNDIIENRHGTKAIILKADPFTKDYHYKYLNPSTPQFQGDFYHSADDMDRFWSIAGKNLTMSTNISPQQFMGRISRQPLPDIDVDKTSCSHEWVDYVGFTHVYKYCKKCDLKA